MRKFLFFKILLISLLAAGSNFGQLIKNENNPLSKNILLTLELSPNYPFTDYENSNIGLAYLGGLEYYLSSKSKSIFGFKINAGLKSYSGEKNNLGLPNTYSTDIKNFGIGVIYSYAVNDKICPYVSIGGSYYWYKFQSENKKSIFFDYSNGGTKNSTVFDLNGGVKFNVGNGMGIIAGIGYHYILDDNIDAIKVGKYNDFALSVSLGLSINLYQEDVDSDGDGIIDKLDPCPYVSEDFDGFEDKDGCPDEDNDGDGIKDDVDLCPNVPEDFDGFKDNDGCPDEDNDGDGIKDVDDQCANNKEDFDGFEDNDGCPDIDNDGDGIVDSLDNCPNAPETFNGYMDDDGCPDELPKPVIPEPEVSKPKAKTPKPKSESRPRENISRAPTEILLHSETTFATNSSQIKSSAFTRLNEIANQMKKYPSVKWRVEAHIDKQNSSLDAVRITKQQAEAIVSYLISRGISGNNLQSVGMGDSSPISSNSSVYGRMKNRRIVIKRLR